MNTTQIEMTRVKWIDGAPSFEAIKGKTILITWDKKCNHQCVVIGTLIYYNEFDWKDLVAYSILTDEPVYCEWERITEGPHKNYFRPKCCVDIGRIMLPVEGQEPFCGHCGNPIRIIEEVKPMELDGYLPKLKTTAGGQYFMKWNGSMVHELMVEEWEYVTPVYDTEREAITAWNSFVERMKK